MSEKLDFDWHWFNRWRKRDARQRARFYESYVNTLGELKRKSWVTVKIDQKARMRAAMRSRYHNYRKAGK